MKPPGAAVSGFTLLEVLLAMAITALVALLAYTGLSTVSTAAERHRLQVERLDEAATAFGWLGRDLQQALPRSITDGPGDRRPALSGGVTQESLLALTRAGWSNLRGARRGMLQRTRYRLEPDGVLWRDHWPVLDRSDEEAGMQSVALLTGVETIELEFLDPTAAGAERSLLGGEWVDEWPPQAASQGATLPLAVRLRLGLAGLGDIERIVGLPDALR